MLMCFSGASFGASVCFEMAMHFQLGVDQVHSFGEGEKGPHLNEVGLLLAPQ